jgi:hypothetical protein
MLRLGLLISVLALMGPFAARAAGGAAGGDVLLLTDYIDETTYTIRHAGAPVTLSIRQLLANLPAYRWDYVLVQGELTTVQVVDLKTTFCHYDPGSSGGGQMLTVTIGVLLPYLDHEADHFGDCLGHGEDTVENKTGNPAGVHIEPPPEQLGDGERQAREQEQRDHEDREDREARNHEQQDREDREARAERSDRADREGRDREERDNRD